MTNDKGLSFRLAQDCCVHCVRCRVQQQKVQRCRANRSKLISYLKGRRLYRGLSKQSRLRDRLSALPMLVSCRQTLAHLWVIVRR